MGGRDQSERMVAINRNHWSQSAGARSLLLIVAIPIFIGLANKAVRENAEAIQQSFGR
jgi:hypothetical protein